jgi:hypothetical protein
MITHGRRLPLNTFADATITRTPLSPGRTSMAVKARAGRFGA